MSEAQEKVTQLEQDVIKIELEKLEKQLEMTQWKSKAFIETSEMAQREHFLRLKTQYEQKIQDL